MKKKTSCIIYQSWEEVRALIPSQRDLFSSYSPSFSPILELSNMWCLQESCQDETGDKYCRGTVLHSIAETQYCTGTPFFFNAHQIIILCLRHHDHDHVRFHHHLHHGIEQKRRSPVYKMLPETSATDSHPLPVFFPPFTSPSS